MITEDAEPRLAVRATRDLDHLRLPLTLESIGG